MGTDKRERQRANRQARAEAERLAAERARKARTAKGIAIAVGLLVIVVLVMSLTSCGSSDPQSDGQASGATTGQQAETPAPEFGTGECPPDAGVEEPVIDFDDAFSRCIDLDAVYVATIDTSEGTVTVELDPSAGAPVAVNNFVSLARFGYFDDTAIFRTEAATGIIQAGSPHTQDNTDPGPGYEIPDEGVPWTSDDYGPGTLAMANHGPDTASGQFFFLASEGGRYLGDPAQIGPSAGAYTVFGKVTDGLDVLVDIANLESPQAPGTPSTEVSIRKVTIAEA